MSRWSECTSFCRVHGGDLRVVVVVRLQLEIKRFFSINCGARSVALSEFEPHFGARGGFTIFG